jgi:hypothetical protein
MGLSRKEYYQTQDQKEKAKIYREKNKEKILAYLKEYRENNKDALVVKNRERSKKNYEKNKDLKLQKQAEQRKKPGYKDKHNEYWKEYAKKRREVDTSFKIQGNMRSRFNSIFKSKKIIRDNSIVELVGCDFNFLKNYIENKFLPTMSWENYGSYWHIDHIKPCSLFDLSIMEEQKKCFHYTNLQPLFATTQLIEGINYIGNLNKSNKYEF